MNAVTIHTLSRPPSTRRQQLAVNPVRVLRKLVHARLRFVLAHELSIAVAMPAEFWNTLTCHAYFETATRIHRDVLVALVGITTVTMGTADLLCEMDVVRENAARPFHDTVTIKAGILAGTSSAAQQCD